ncbi:MAG: CHAD domain-containing protein [Trichodesmium sp. MAG_R04]|nr:CHAD domain-containing protein [Trichodesmium sp. MAG_R04]
MNTQVLQKSNSIGYWASLAFEKHFQKTLKHELEVLKDKEPEELHQMRIGIRRLRSAAQGFRLVVALPKAAQDQKIGKIARCLGGLRDLDVLLEALENRYKPNLSTIEQVEIEQALQKLREQRHQAFKKVRKLLKHQSYLMFKEKFQEWLNNPIYRDISQLPIQKVLPDLLLPEISQLFLHPGWLVGIEKENWETNNNHDFLLQKINSKDQVIKINDDTSAININDAEKKKLHSLRKKVKEVRYQMSLFTEFYGSTYKAYLKDMKELQEYLGDIQDGVVLRNFLESILQSNIDKVLPSLVKQLQQDREKALRKWQVLQRRYLNIQVRQNFRLELLRPLNL